ncbi:hypothetical protein [Metabacillus niabensis]|uniref:hypothetical protein n=1 Tax=Metabacillus TaxID=2675233 RepID=UPI000BA6BBCC|nr:hypothetical protein CHH83_09010 [Bacillus sp. 7586-K]
MGFATIFLVSWLITVIFFVMKKEFSFLENSFVILFVLIININWSWMIYEEWKLLEISAKPLNHTAFIITRSLTIPLIIATAMNYIRPANSFGKSLLIMLVSTFILVLLSILSRYFHITKPIKWNLLYDILYFFSLQLITYFFLNYFKQHKQTEVEG